MNIIRDYDFIPFSMHIFDWLSIIRYYPGFIDLATTVINKSQLHSVPESAVIVSVAGQRGLKFHGIPILPANPPGAVPQNPHVSVTMLKKNSDTFPRSRSERMLAQTWN